MIRQLTPRRPTLHLLATLTGGCPPSPFAALALRALDPLPHERTAVVAFGQQLIVGAAERADVGRRRRSAATEGVFVMQLEKAALLAGIVGMNALSET